MLELENKENADTLVLAGDIMLAADVGIPKYEWFFENCSKEFKNVIYIMGNHEYYNSEFEEARNLLKILTDKFPNVHFLENEVVKIDGIFFYGGTFWTTANNCDPLVVETIKKGMTDFHLIRNGDKKFTPMDAANVHVKALEGLNLLVDGLGNDEKVVVVSHHAPSRQSIHPRYENYTALNYAYHENLEDFIVNHPQIKLWFHGHVHTPFDYNVGGTRVLCNPRGYIGHEREAYHFNLKYVEV